MNPQLKDILTIGFSALAFILALASFVWTFVQRSSENRRTIRKALTDVIEELSATNIASTQLNIDYPESRDRRSSA
jgi:hypothetical protein